MKAKYKFSKMHGRKNPFILTLQEKKIEKDLLMGAYKPVSDKEFRAISKSIAACSSKRLAKLGGTEKKLKNIPRRRIGQNIHRGSDFDDFLKEEGILEEIQAKTRNLELLSNIRRSLPELEKLLKEVNSHWVYEDLIYRFYHQSFKVYAIQAATNKIAEALKNIAPSGTTLCPMFKELYQAGASGKQFKIKHNQQWAVHTRPFLEAFFHAKFFLEMAVRYGKGLKTAPAILPSGWAALLCLYNLR